MQSHVPAYLTYPKQFTPYKWYKPLLVGLLTIVFCLLFSFGVTLIGTVIGARQTGAYQGGQRSCAKFLANKFVKAFNGYLVSV